MQSLINTIGIAVIVAAMIVIAFFFGKHSNGYVAKDSVAITDTVWVEVHDTAFIVKETRTVRHDTVLLALANVHENGISGSYADTLFIHDSVYVEIPIEEKTFIGENYTIITEGYRTRLKDVAVYMPNISTVTTSTVVKRRHWTGGIGVQIGYGYTSNGLSPYAGLGISFGYVF